MGDNSANINDLKDRIVDGDFKALDQLYKRLYKPLIVFGKQSSPAVGKAALDDSIQELFLWIAKHPQKLKEIDNLEIYLFKAFKNNVNREAHKTDKRQKNNQQISKILNNAFLELSPETKLINSEEVNKQSLWVKDLLSSLPPKQNEVLYLRYYQNMNYREISMILGLSEQVVRNYSYRAIRKLKGNVDPLKLNAEV